MTYDAWRLQSAEDAGFYRFDERDEDDDMTREEQLSLEAHAYVRRARGALRNACLVSGWRAGRAALADIAAARAALHEAALRFAELQKLEDAADEMPF